MPKTTTNHINSALPIIQIIAKSNNLIMFRYSHHNEYHIDSLLKISMSLQDLLEDYTMRTGDKPTSDAIVAHLITLISKCTPKEQEQLIEYFK